MRVTLLLLTRRGTAVAAAALAAGAILGGTDRATAGSERVPADYYGVNFQNPYDLLPAVRDKHVQLMEANRITEARIPLPWSGIEPYAPTNSGHSYYWNAVDEQVAALARNGVRVQGMLAYAPRWAASGTSAEVDLCRERGAAGLGTGAPNSYAAVAEAVARRYGVGGDFWSERPELPRLPMRVFEIWNAPNTVGTWCPRPDPEGYGVIFDLAARAIHRVNANARVVVGGVGLGGGGRDGVATDEFLRRMVAARPSVRHLASAVGVHAYPGKNLDRQLVAFPKFRDWIRAAGIPDSVPMLINEIGFSRAGDIDMTEPERVASYRNMISKLSRTNCNISGILPYTWMTRERFPNDASEWFGIASPAGGWLYPSGEEFIHWVDLFRGHLAEEAPRNTVELCPGMPLPDQDGDGAPDENDGSPLDPSRSGGGGGGGSGGGGGGSGDPGDDTGGGGGDSPRRCSIRGTSGPDRLVGTRGADVICGRGGNDLIYGRRGGDTIKGGRGSDAAIGGRGQDLIRGSRGADVLSGGRGKDTLKGGRGRDLLRGGRGLDLLRGGPGRDRKRQ